MDARQLTQEIKKLIEEKGILSRKIGERKKQGQAFDDLIKAMQAVSKSLKSKQTDLEQLTNSAANQATDSEEALTKAAFPEHIGTYSAINVIDTSGVVVCVAQDADKDAWNQYVDQHPHSHIYHRYEFKTVISQSFGHPCYYFMAKNAANEVIGIMPTVFISSKLFGKYIASIPFFNYGGPLCQSAEISTQLIDEAVSITKSSTAVHLEIRESQQRTDFPCKDDKVSMFLRLPEDSETLWQDLGTKVRAQIKKGQKNGLTIEFGGTELIDDYYRVFSTNMRDLGTPVYSKQFFSNLLQQGMKSTLVVQYHRNKPVSCGFLLGYKQVLEIPWASTLRTANHLDANMVMYWEILKHACEHNYEFFDFGRSSKDASTFKFKKQWGAHPAPLFWNYWLKEGKLPQLNPNNPKYQLMIAVWRRLPVWLTQLIGPSIVKNLP